LLSGDLAIVRRCAGLDRITVGVVQPGRFLPLLLAAHTKNIRSVPDRSACFQGLQAAQKYGYECFPDLLRLRLQQRIELQQAVQKNYGPFTNRLYQKV
jgi:hypothetical protein